MFANPYVLLGALLSAMALFAGGYSLGKQHEADACVARQSAVTNAALADARTQSEADIAAAQVKAKAAVLADARNREAKLNGVIDALRKSRPSCGRDAESAGLLNAAIDAANGDPQAGTTERVPDGVLSPDEAKGR